MKNEQQKWQPAGSENYKHLLTKFTQIEVKITKINQPNCIKIVFRIKS